MSDGVQSFYGRWARPYDALARHAPVVGRLRARAVDRLALSPGDTVLDMGCGTGANLPSLRERVGPDGTVVGVDVTGPMLARARRLVDRRGWENVHLVRGDAARPPVATHVDGVLATFVVGMFDDPRAVVDGWCDLVASDDAAGGPAEGGSVAMLDAARSDSRAAAPVNLAFDAFTVLSTPPTWQLRYDRSIGDSLHRRVVAAREALDARGDADHETHLLGLLRLSAGAVG
jgi:phosphatidylethanolamine/phosphatidyl-N-methylethanolamine N-methyltransferase